MKKTVFRPKSAPFIITLILLCLLILGLLSLLIIGFFKLNWIYILVGILSLCFIVTEFILILKAKIVFYESKLVIPYNIFDKYIYMKKVQKEIDFNDIETFTLTKNPTQIIYIKCYNKQEPIAMYVKQYSKKQISQMMEALELKITDKKDKA